MNPRVIIAGVMVLAVAAGGYFFWIRRAGVFSGPPAVEICTRDLYALFRENSTKPLSAANARARCECINRELEKTADGREVLGLIVQYKKFMSIIESAASHATAFEAMALCNH